VSDTLAVDATGRARFGCIFALAALLVGAVIAFGQGWILVHTWAYCQAISPAIAVDQYPRGGAYVWLFPWTVRVLVYSAMFGVTGAVVRGRFGRGIPLALGCALMACLVLFAADYSVFSGMAGADPPAAYLPGRCPGGHLPWWPV
jgi:hypothetical protein